MLLLDLLVDLSNVGAPEDKAQAYGRLKDRVAMKDTPGEIATTLLRKCVGSDGAPLLKPGQYEELVDGRLAIRMLN